MKLPLGALWVDTAGADYVILTGPTGVGKSAVAYWLARRVPLEIISADSRQAYRGMDIGTDTPPPETLRSIPHHLVNIINPDQIWSAGAFAREARKRILQIRSRGRLPLVVGGAMLYLDALQFGLFKEVRKDLELRSRYAQRLAEEGAETLWQELERIDPEYAHTFHWNDHKKLIRAFEIYESTGQPPSVVFQNLPDPFPLRGFRIALVRNREELYQRINQRVEKMFQRGLVAECRCLLEKGYSPDEYALRSIGYQEVFKHLRGEISLAETIALVQRNTRRFAKRQLTWIRNRPGPNQIIDFHSLQLQ